MLNDQLFYVRRIIARLSQMKTKGTGILTLLGMSVTTVPLHQTLTNVIVMVMVLEIPVMVMMTMMEWVRKNMVVEWSIL